MKIFRHGHPGPRSRPTRPQDLGEALAAIAGPGPVRYLMVAPAPAAAGTWLDVRPSTVDDAAALHALLARAAVGPARARLTSSLPPDPGGRPGPGDEVLLAEHRRAAIGCCWTDGALGTLELVAVDPAWRGHGIGRQLVRAGLDSLAARGHDRVEATIDAADLSGVALLSLEGFTIERVDLTG